jgi:DNA-binding CsgD family transcriptional regulator
MKRTAELAQLRQLCRLGLHGEAIMPAFLRALRALVPAGSGAFFWVDANGDMTHMYAEKMLPAEVTGRYFRQHYESAVHAFRERVLAQARKGEPARETVADAATLASDYYREVLEPLGAYRTLHAVVQERGTPLGQLSLYRAQRAPAFGSGEREIVETACRYLLQALRATGAAGGGAASNGADQFRESGQAALLVCGHDGHVQQASGRGHALLAQASGCRINRYTIVGELEQAGIALLRRLLAGALADDALDDGPAHSLQVVNEWGAFRLRAYPLGEGFGVLIERFEHLLVRLVDAMRALRLSAQQREVALLLARGMTNPQVARALGVSLNTASYHVKQLFAKLDAHDRAEVIARVLGGHTARY